MIRADAAALPFSGESADLVVACMSLLDLDDFAGAVTEIGRVLRPGGQLCWPWLHPFISTQDEDALHMQSVAVSRPYLQTRRYTDRIERDATP